MSTMFLILSLVCAQPPDPIKDAPAITKEQEKLIELMGDNDYKIREKATDALGKMDYAGLRAMYKAAKSGDPEISRRASTLLSQYYSCQNSKNEIPGIQGLYEMKSWKLKSGKTMEIAESDANDYYMKAGGDKDDNDMKQDANNFHTREATSLLIKKLRDKGFSKKDVAEVLDKIATEGNGNEMGNTGWRKFREMQGLPEYEPWGPGLGFAPGLWFRGMRNMRNMRNMIGR